MQMYPLYAFLTLKRVFFKEKEIKPKATSQKEWLKGYWEWRNGKG